MMRFLVPDWHDALPSTNSCLIDRLRAGVSVPSGYVLAARQQTAGRGRRGRTWISTAGQDLTFSVVVRAKVPPLGLVSLPMAVTLGVATALEQHYQLCPSTKWPNDLLIGERKICGVLSEVARGAVVVGVGLNVNMPPAVADTIDRPVTSMFMETGRQHGVENVLGSVLGGLARWISKWEEGAFAALRPDWTDRCAQLGRVVGVWAGDSTISGRLVGFGTWGQALLAQTDGTLLEAWAGDLTES